MNIKNNSVIDIISKYKKALMGLSILLIIIFHSGINIKSLSIIKSFGYIGVDIFMFLSGIGIYYSLKKNNDYIQFYKKRFKRIFPSYIPILIVACVLWYIADFVNVSTLFFEICGNIFMVGFFSGLSHQFNWYVQAICWFYLISPIIFYLLNRFNRRNLFNIGLVILLCLVGVFFIGNITLMAFSRIPIFVIGMMLANYCENKEIKKIAFIKGILFANTLLGFILLTVCYLYYRRYLWSHGLWWYPLILITPGLTLLVSKIFEFLNKRKISNYVIKVLELIGSFSFELYLLDILVFEFIRKKELVNNNLLWIFIDISVIILGIAYGRLIDWCKNRLIKKEVSLEDVIDIVVEDELVKSE